MDFRRAETTDEILSLLSELGPDAAILAGGTDLMVQYLRGEVAPRVLLHIEGVSELRGVRLVDDVLEIGTATTHRDVGSDHQIRTHLPGLAEAARQVGGFQTQAVGTVGGNICNASPAADTVPPLLVADAEALLVSSRGSRVVPLGRFLLGRRRTGRRPDELLAAIRARPLPSGSGETYLKVGRRGGMEVAIVGLAARVGFSGETITDVRLAVCSMAPTPLRLPEAEQTLVGTRGEPEAVAAAAAAILEATEPIDDARATAAYRRRLVEPLVGEAMRICRRRARGEEVAWN